MKRTIFAVAILAVLMLCAASSSKSQIYIGKQFGLTGTAHVALDSVAGSSADTLRLARTKYSVITIHGKRGTSDTLTAISGGVSGRVYVFQTSSQDTAVVLVKGTTNMRMAATTVLNDTAATAMFWYDGKLYRKLSSDLNH